MLTWIYEWLYGLVARAINILFEAGKLAKMRSECRYLLVVDQTGRAGGRLFLYPASHPNY